MATVRALGSWRASAGAAVAVGGQWRNVTGVLVRKDGAWRRDPDFVPSFSASAPTEVEGYSYTSKPILVRVISDQASISVTGGTGPYAYNWNRTVGDSRIIANSSTMAGTVFSASLRAETASAGFVWTVTDAAGNTASGTVNVTLTAEGSF